jgi:putative sterol carrier protein
MKYCSNQGEHFVIRKSIALLAFSGIFAFSGAALAQSDADNANAEDASARTEQSQPAAENAPAGETAGEETTVAGQVSAGDLEPMMSVEYIKQFCDAWNADELMTKGLADSEWVDNDGDKGYKVIQLYRRDCPDSPRVEMQFERKDDRAVCVYAGKVENPDLDRSADYEMFADTKRWEEVGNGEYGPMKAMMFGRLKFKGPKIEAMGNMGPFKNFLLLFGKFPSDKTRCP